MLEYLFGKATKCSVVKKYGNLEDVAEKNSTLACKITERALWVSQRFYVSYGCDI